MDMPLRVFIAIVCTGASFWILYEVIRAAVRDGIRDAREREAHKDGNPKRQFSDVVNLGTFQKKE